MPRPPGNVRFEGFTAVTMKREKMKLVVVRDAAMVGKEKNLTLVLKVPRHCPFVLPVRVKH
jgi:hypothetical protein